MRAPPKRAPLMAKSIVRGLVPPERADVFCDATLMPYVPELLLTGLMLPLANLLLRVEAEIWSIVTHAE